MVTYGMLKTVAELEKKNREIQQKLHVQNDRFLSQIQALKFQFDIEFKQHAEKLQVFEWRNVESTQTILKQEQKIIQQAEKIEFQKQEYEKLIQMVLELRRHQFGSKSERFIDFDNQMPLFEGASLEEKESSEEPIEYETIQLKRKKKTDKKEPVIPTREEIIPVEDKTCRCGSERKVIDHETKTILHFVPAQFEIILQKREVVACNYCQNGMETAQAPLQLLPKCKASESLLTHIAVSKILDRQPLYHLEKKFEREFGWIISRRTMARWMIMMADKLIPLVNLLKDTLLEYDVASADATSLQVLNEPGRRAEEKSSAFCIRGGAPEKKVVLFEYLDTNPKTYLKSVFSEYNGTIHIDASNVYDELSQQKGIQLALCHAHVRRKFEHIYKASKNKDGLAKHALSVYRQLYGIERVATEKSMTPEELKKLRETETKPILNAFKQWLDHYSELVFPKSPIGLAIAYARNNWAGLQVFLTDGRLSPDNNATEREIKTFVMARKNFLFCDTQAGADALGALFSIILTAKHNGLNPTHYFEKILKKAPLCNSFEDWEALLPWNITDELAENKPEKTSPLGKTGGEYSG